MKTNRSRVVPYIYHVLLVEREGFVALIVCSPTATIGLVLDAPSLELLIISPIAYQRAPTILLIHAPCWTNLINEDMSIQ
jgi:hypothetical protein